jgi:pimeloyl-ACP methyl ester carboxylesterase
MSTDSGSGAEGTATFDADGVRIAYDDVGEGEPIVLVHGFASSRRGNWEDPGWYDALVDAGRRVVALDCRGHGESEKPHDPGDYGHDAMAEDVVRLMDHLSIETADLMGYSMGGAITMQLLAEHADRFNAAVVAGAGTGVVDGLSGREHIADALEADDVEDVETPMGRRFRLFAEESDNDLLALAAVMRSRGEPIDADRLAEASLPVLSVAGSDDDLVDDPGDVADLFPDSEAVTVEGTDHLTTVGDPRYREAVLEFLAREGL